MKTLGIALFLALPLFCGQMSAADQNAESGYSFSVVRLDGAYLACYRAAARVHFGQKPDVEQQALEKEYEVVFTKRSDTPSVVSITFSKRDARKASERPVFGGRSITYDVDLETAKIVRTHGSR